MEISVIVPAYNAERYLENTLKSILNQSFEDFEVILVNDGSVDKTPEIMATYAAQDKRIKVINKKNEGVGAARNTGMRVASGKYLYFADADDILHPQILEFLYWACEKEQADFSCCDFVAIEENTFPKMVVYDKNVSGEVIYKPLELMCDNRKKINNNVWTKLYKKEALGDIVFADYRCAQDLYFNICAMRHFSKGVFVPLPLYFYVLSSESITRKVININYLNTHLVLYEQLKKDFEDKPEVWEKIKRKIINGTCYYHVKQLYKMKDRNLRRELRKTWLPQVKKAMKKGVIGFDGFGLKKRIKFLIFLYLF